VLLFVFILLALLTSLGAKWYFHDLHIAMRALCLVVVLIACCVGCTFSLLNPLALVTHRQLLSVSCTLRGDILGIVQDVIAHGRRNPTYSELDPRLLVDNSHVLAKGTLYEDVVRELMLSAAVDDRAHIHAADAFLKGFVSSERKKRLKLKVNYILAGAQSKRLDEAIDLLSER
jgi:hypothetical protein